MRLTKEELEKLKIEKDIDTLWSWSRVSSWDVSKYEWYLNYILHEPEDRSDCIYGTAGGYMHEILEDLYMGIIAPYQMPSRFEDDWYMANEVLGLKFDRNNPEQNTKLAKNYYANLQHFYNNHILIPYHVNVEDFALIHIGDNYMQGYIDAWYEDDDGNINICDWKSSSIYTGDNLIHKSGQLVLYGIKFLQDGVPIEKIKPKFNFLKYCTVSYMQKNGKPKSMNVERRLLGEKLQTPAKLYLKQYGYDPDSYLMELLDTNGELDVLPEEVANEITITDCWVEVPFNQEQIDYWTKYITNTINEIESKISEYKKTESEEVFYDSPEEVKAQSYFFATLSGYSPKLNVCYQKYLDSLEQQEDIWS